MVRVATVWKSEGNVDLSRLTLRQKLSVFINHMIDHSTFLSGNKRKLEALKEEEDRKKVLEYMTSFLYHLEKGPFRTAEIVPFTFDIDDIEFVRLALGSPQFFGYEKIFVPMDRNLSELQAFKLGVVTVRRLIA